MSRRIDFAIALGLLGAGLVPIAVGVFLGRPTVSIAGLLLLGATLPVSFKLVRYPSTRQVPLGDLVGTFRRDRRGPLSTGGMLVCFSGIDGSGKTTQAELLVEEFEKQGVDAGHVWARWRPSVSYLLMGVLYVTLGWRRKDYSKSAVLRRIWGYFLLADQMLFFARYIYPKLRRGGVVCVDRYVVDQLVEMRYDGLFNERAARLIEAMLPTPDVTFVMDVPPDVALDRKDDTQEMLDRLGIDEDARSYLSERRRLFLEVAEASDADVVDTTRSLEETQEEIRERAVSSYFEF